MSNPTANPTRALFIEGDRSISRAEFDEGVASLAGRLGRRIKHKAAFALEAENSVNAYTRLLALLQAGHAVLPCPSYQFRDPAFRRFLKQETLTDFVFCGKAQELSDAMDADPLTASEPGGDPQIHPQIHPMIQAEMDRGAAPLILRTSGSSGKKYKFVLHDHRRFGEKHAKVEPHFERTLAFSPFESVAGTEVLTEALAHGRTVVVAGERLTPAAVARLLREHAIDYFQTTPTFLTLMLISRSLTADFAGSLKKIAYGSERPSKATLQAIQKLLPGVELMHTYGMTEIGILRTRTCPDDPTLLAFDERYNSGRIADGFLETRCSSTMIGYLNFPFETTPDGWFRTGDAVEKVGAYFHVLGRADDTINVAGRKFFPTELEELLLRMGNVADVTIHREKNDLVGEAIVAQVALSEAEDEAAFRVRFRAFCEANVPFFMHPHRLIVDSEVDVSPRFKKMRRS